MPRQVLGSLTRDEAAVVYTSALSGTLLGASLTHANLLSNARATVEAGAMSREVHALAVLPFARSGIISYRVKPLRRPGTRKRELAAVESARRRIRVSGARRAVEAILGVTVLLYLFGVVVALWP